MVGNDEDRDNIELTIEQDESLIDDVHSKEEVHKKESNYLEQLQRLQAEFDNYIKRVDKGRADIIRMANEDLIIKLLLVLDNFELALKHNEDKGVNMIYSELYAILEKEGVKPIKSEGKFNPRYHEVLIQEEGDNDDEIVSELQKGYILGDKVIRAAKVKISKSSEKTK